MFRDLLQHRGQVRSYIELSAAMGKEYSGGRSTATMANTIRRRVAGCAVIENIAGYGYRLR